MDFPAVTEGRNTRGTLTAEALLTEVTLYHGLVMSSGESAQMSFIYKEFSPGTRGGASTPGGNLWFPSTVLGTHRT